MTDDLKQKDTSEMSPEEYVQRKKAMQVYWDEEVSFLESQKRYQTLIADIEEQRMRYIRAQVAIANMIAPEPEPKPEPSPEKPDPESKERKLKTV